MKHSKRFTNAVTKLYNAFHNGELLFGNCAKCAVGSIVGHDRWFMNSPSKVWRGVFKEIDKCYVNNNDSGYFVEELYEVEKIFILAFDDYTQVNDKERQFKGLCAVIEYLCELEGIPNVMYYTCLFEYDDNKAKHELREVFV